MLASAARGLAALAACPIAALAADDRAGAALDFQHENTALPAQAMLALLFLVVVTAIAWFIVSRSGGGSLAQSLLPKIKTPMVRVVQVKRIAPRLTIATVLIDEQRTVSFVDNGHSMLILSDQVQQASQQPSTETPS